MIVIFVHMTLFLWYQSSVGKGAMYSLNGWFRESWESTSVCRNKCFIRRGWKFDLEVTIETFRMVCWSAVIISHISKIGSQMRFLQRWPESQVIFTLNLYRLSHRSPKGQLPGIFSYSSWIYLWGRTLNWFSPYILGNKDIACIQLVHKKEPNYRVGAPIHHC